MLWRFLLALEKGGKGGTSELRKVVVVSNFQKGDRQHWQGEIQISVEI